EGVAADDLLVDGLVRAPHRRARLEVVEEVGVHPDAPGPGERHQRERRRPHRISRRLANARSPRRRRFSESAGEILPARAERRRVGMSWSEAGRYVKQATVRQTTPTTAKSPRSQMAVMRFTMSEPNPITVVTAAIVRG